VLAAILFVVRRNQIIWSLLALEIINLGLLNYVGLHFDSAWLLYLISFQVIERVLLILLVLIRLREALRF
jgi:hypothetical protein